nr:integrase, catalytic region, zinc finger, CCHC-type, peptidase aspartic, catalytic [Tanacetum cinerariifolium]
MEGLWFRMFRVNRIEVKGPIHKVEVQLGMREFRTELGMLIQDLALNVDNVFQADDCVAFDFDVDEAPTAQTVFMANMSSADPVYDEAGPSYDLDILSKCNLPGSGISFLLVVGTIFTSSGMFFWQWELYSW